MWSIFQLQDLLGMSDNIRRENSYDERINVHYNTKNFFKYQIYIIL
jgi:4-alpha-glucanotransferase